MPNSTDTKSDTTPDTKPRSDSKPSPEVLAPLLRNAMLKALSGTQRLIILLRYAEQMTTDEIALAIDMTAQQVERHHEEAIRLLRDSVGLQAA